MVNRARVRRNWLAIGVVAPIVGLVASSCVTAAAGGAAATLDKSARQQLLSEIETSGSTLSTLNQANQVLIHRCMAKLGFTYYVMPMPPQAQTPTSSHEASLSMAYRLTNGWGLYAEFLTKASTPAAAHSTGALGPAASGPEATYMTSLTPQQQAKFRVALSGPPHSSERFHVVGMGTLTGPSKGCEATAQKSLYGSVITAQDATGISAMATEVLLDAQRLPQFKTVQSAYKACMTKAGDPATSPKAAESQIADDYAKNGPTAQMRAEEIAAAVADLKCQNEVGYQKRLAAAETEEVAKIGAHVVGQVERLLQDQSRAIVKAKKLIGKH